MNQLDVMHSVQSIAFPWLDRVMVVITTLGNVDFYVAVIPLILWTIDKKLGARLAVFVFLSLCCNELVKMWFAIPRPIGYPGVRSLYTSSAPGYSFPSGHAQGSATFWGYLAWRIQNRLFTWMTAAIVLLIAFSRVYLGLHWPQDVIAGAVFGVLFVGVAAVIDYCMTRMPRVTWLGLLAGIGLPILFLLTYHGTGGDLAGFLLGVSSGYWFENYLLRFQIPYRILPKLTAAVIGLTGILLLQHWIDNLPDFFLKMAGYILMGWWSSFIAPSLFLLFGLFRRKMETVRK